jgi:PAS domain S-box-containing protein/putative nucleotidyltransferase with HDIG domain
MKGKSNKIEELINELGYEKESAQLCALKIFSETAAKLTELSPKDDIYQIIGAGLHELVEGSVVMVNSFEEASGVFHIHAIEGAAKHLGHLAKMLGVHNVVGMSLSINDEAKRELNSGTLKKVSGGFYGLSMGNIPKSICSEIEKLLSVRETYAIGFTWRGQLFGSANFLLCHDNNYIDLELIKAFAGLSSLALKHGQVMEALQTAHGELEQRVKERTTELEKVNEELRAEVRERKRAIKILKASEERYSLVLKNCNQAICVAQDGVFKFVSPKATEISGYSEKELTSRPFITLVHPDDQETVFKYHMERISGKYVPPVYSFRIVDKENNIKWIEINAVAISWENKPATLNFLSDITERKQAVEKVQQSYQRLQATMQGTIKVMSSIVELRDPYTAGHQFRVTKLACRIAEIMGLPSEQIDGLRAAGLVHDIGKIYVPTEILSKPGQLSDTELTMIKAHPKVGYDILKQIEFPWPVADIVLQHHERLNGTGYPSGLSGDDILIEARILAVADVIEATASHRPYRAGLGIDSALEEISQAQGVLYDSKVVEACLTLFKSKGFSF